MVGLGRRTPRSEQEIIQEAGSMGLGNLILDQWSFLDFKEAMRAVSFIGNGGGVQAGLAVPFMHTTRVPSWVGRHARRLQAYMILDAYYRNSAKHYIPHPQDGDQDDRRDRREYGEPYLIVETIKSSVLGNDQKPVVDGAIDVKNDKTSDEGKCQTELEKWWKKEKVPTKLIAGEKHGHKLGDIVYVLGWDKRKNRARLRVYDPGFYFPVLDPAGNDDDFPRRVHLAWEFLDIVDSETSGVKKTVPKVRRITWDLRENEPEYNLSWNDEKSTDRCYMRDGVWLLSDIDSNLNDVDLFEDEGATWNIPSGEQDDGNGWIDLGIDFMPVIHMPNTVVDECEHYGLSSLAAVIQIFDDIVSTDTDMQRASATTGSPPIALKNASLEGDAVSVYGPGEIIETGDGEATVIDTSKSLDALLKYDDRLHNKLSINGRVPETLLGRVDPAKVNAGIILTLSFAPHTGLIKEMRQIRDDGHSRLLKFKLRLDILNGVLDLEKPEQLPVANIKLGSYLPADRQEVMGIITNGASNHMMSRYTTVAMMIEAGYPIDDIAEEIKRIHQEDFAGAVQLEQATQDAAVPRAYLRGDDPLPLEGDHPLEPTGSGTPGAPGVEKMPLPGQDGPQNLRDPATRTRPDSTPPGVRV